MGGPGLPSRLVALIDILGRHYGAATERSDAVRDQALDRGDEVIDLTYRPPPSAAESVRTLNELMDEADEFCRSEQLLTLAATQVERGFVPGSSNSSSPNSTEEGRPAGAARFVCLVPAVA